MIKSTLFIICLATFQFVNSQVEIFNEDFQTGLPLTFTIVDNDGLTPHSSVSEFGNAWISLVDPSNSNDTIVGSTSYFDPAGTADRWLITPAITLGSYGNFLFWDAKSHDPSYPDSYKIFISTTDTQLSSFTDTLAVVISEISDWNSRSINLSEIGYNDQTVYIAFVNQTEDGFKLYIDDIRVEKENTSSISTLESTKFNVYPNPVSNVLHIETVKEIEVVRIISPEGKIILETLYSNEINVEGLQPSVYYIEIESAGESFRTPFIKK